MHHVLDRMYARLDEHSKSRLQQLGGMCMCGCVGVCKGIRMVGGGIEKQCHSFN